MKLKLFAAWTILAIVGQTQMWAPSSRELRHPAKAGLPRFLHLNCHHYHHFNHQICYVSFSCWSGMLATMSGWKAMLGCCQKPFLSNWRRYKSQVLNITPLDLTCVDLRLLNHQPCFRSYVLRPRRWFWLLCWGRPGDIRTQTWHNVLE